MKIVLCTIPGPGVICGLSLLLVLFLDPRGFSPGTPVFPSPQKPTFLNSNSIWIIVKHFIMSLWLELSPKHSLCLTLNSHLHFMCWNHRSDSCPFQHTSHDIWFASRANICFKNIKFPRGNYQPIVARQKHYCLNRNLESVNMCDRVGDI